MIDPERTLFTFPDRVFSYRCAGCAACCKGHGIGLDATGGEVAHLTRAYPQVVAFLRRRGDAMTAFNPRDRCWFLDGEALCRIEREHGRSHKPASCRLFPFNRIYRIGSWAVVDYNSVLCPLEIGGEPAVAHADILAEIATVADRAVIGTSLGSGEEDGRALVERERAIADRLFAAAAAADLDAAWAAQSGVTRPPVDEAFQVMLGAPWAAPDPVTLAGALWLSPSLRFNELYGPRKYAPRDQLLAALPGMWLAWIGFAGLGARLAGRPLGLQELTTIWSEQAPLGYIAARWNDPTAIRPAEPTSDPLARRLARALSEGGGAALGAVLTPIAAAFEPAERVAGLKLAEPLLRAAF